MNCIQNKYIDNRIYCRALLIGLAALIPTTKIGIFIRVLIITGIYISVFAQNGFKVRINLKLLHIIVLIILSYSVSFIYGLIAFTPTNWNLLIHELLRTILNVSLLLLIPTIKCNYRTIYLACVIVGMTTVAIGFIQWINPYLIQDLIMKFWVDGTEIPVHLTLSYATERRLGSIFINPNVGGLAVAVCVPLFIYDYMQSKRRANLIYILASFVFIMLTQSRTAMGLLLIFIVYAIIKELGLEEIRKLFVVGLIGLIGLVVAVFAGVSIPYVRSLDFSSAFNNGVGGSLYVKLSVLFNYLKNSNCFSIILGSIGGSHAIDSEWNYILGFYGLLGIIWYIGLLVYFWKYKGAEVLVRRLYVFVFIFAGLTETTYFCMPIISLVLLTVLGNRGIYSGDGAVIEKNSCI